MTKLLLTLALVAPAFATPAFAKPTKPAAPQQQALKIVSGVVESMMSMENESLVKIKGSESMYSIKNLTSFPEAKLRALSTSKETGSTVKIKVTEKNEIVDVIL